MTIAQTNIDELKDRYLAGESAADLGKDLGFSGETVRRWLRPLGVMRKKSETARKLLTKYSQREDAFNIARATPDMAYWAGWLCADGSVRTGKAVAMSLARRDIEILKQLKIWSNFTGPISSQIKNGNKEYARIIVFSQQWIHSLADWGVVPRKTYNGSNITQVMKLDCFPLFFRGLFEGDGCIHVAKSGKPYLSASGRPEVIDHLRCWMWNVDRNPGSLNRRSLYLHVVQFGGQSAVRAAKRLYDGSYPELALHRKKKLIDTIIK